MDRPVGTLTVGKLIQILSKLPKDLPVLSEGCDCYGEAGNAIVVVSDEAQDSRFYTEDYVLIQRLDRM